MNPTTPIAENHICISRALFREGMRAAENKEYRKSIGKVAVCMLLLFAGAAAWLLYTGGSLFFLLGEAIFLGALLFWLAVIFPGTKRRRKYRAMMQGSDHVPERTSSFYQDRLIVTANTGKETVILYDSIIGWQETEHLYILNCQNSLSVLLDKKGFVSGDFHTVKIALESDN